MSAVPDPSSPEDPGPESTGVDSAPMSLYPKRPGEEEPSLVVSLGALVVEQMRLTGRLIGTLVGATARIFDPGEAASQVSWRIAVRQIFFTGFEALPLVSVIAAFVGASIIIQMQIMAATLPSEMVGRILVAVVLREFAPLVTAVIVAGRSGTAMATELGNMKANAEVLGLASLGIDPLRFIVFPRLVGTVVSVLVLTVYFGALAIMGGYAVSVAMGASSFEALRGGFIEGVVPGDLPLYLIKGIGLGTIVGWLCCHFGLEVQASPTEVPQRASHAVVMSLLACVVFNTLVTAGFYAIVGPPVR